MAGIYIHIPYCKKLCSYCDFYHVVHPGDSRSFLDALQKEAGDRHEYLLNQEVTTIYLGGGTPSLLTAAEIKELLSVLSSEYQLSKEPEITAELNPDDVDEGYAGSLREAGINRISLGLQSWHNDDLKLLGRRHKVIESERALTGCLAAGFENVTVDLIYGIPGMDPERWTDNLRKTFSYQVAHLSAYHLTIEPGTLFGKMKERGVLSEIDEEDSSTQFNILLEETEKAGFIQYEISNFGKAGRFSEHNSNYWKQVPYLGLGPSAHSFNGYSRQWNIRDVKKYIKMINGGIPCFEKEELDQKTRFNEYVMTSLRTMWGIDLAYIEKQFEKEGYDYVLNIASKFLRYGMLNQEKNALVLTNQGKMISDNIISEFIMPADK
jgi:oxygen-independent coproporphyrinogen III oxidase